ncbi:hypothetical protein ASF87_07275 [Microbacterium sp. Leaf161]|uniref:hypothetical protein n=1 Tax=Microbacterium sp. Leaf161 TaxID=1736281 RepID=UPI0006FD9D99|nr:hypothetical protein [Microbacterium sp. Leaf161]KQR48654.1 hypothetical protein ASF87_07275 [Microbacterium sp. Leaf161]
MPHQWVPLDLGESDLDADDPEEQMGSKEKNWVRIADDDRRWLVKVARVDERDGTISGEDWAEWLVQHIANSVGVPTAHVRPALFEGQRATASRSMLRNDSERLIHGNELLSARFPNYDQSIRGENPGYTLSAVQDAVVGIPGPPDLSIRLEAFDTIAGYLMCDALVAGRDRHHENWGVIRRGGDRWLAPSFDHGNALGFQERDAKRMRLLRDRELFDRWVRRGTSQHFVGRPTLVDLAIGALRVSSRDAQDFWIGHLHDFQPDGVDAELEPVPHDVMSEVSRRFVVSLLDTNRRRLLDGYSAAPA